jgi:hypothetical protein
MFNDRKKGREKITLQTKREDVFKEDSKVNISKKPSDTMWPQ